jgi:hypothetical protein
MAFSGRLLLLIAAIGCATAAPAGASSRPDAHAPIGVMGDHTHKTGEWMFSYRFMAMGMNGLLDGAESISRSKVLQDFMVTPTRMEMQMHMFGAMVAPIERLTVMVMVPWVELEMDHKTRMGTFFTTRSEGLGDVRVSGLIDLWDEGSQHVHLNLGVSFPSGSITEQDKTPMSGGAKVRIPYPMQIGSGTYDFLPGLTYTGASQRFSWGAQATGEIRMNENHADYRVGNEYELTAWGAIKLADWVSSSVRLAWRQAVNYRGRDDSIAIVTPGGVPTVPTADPGRQAVAQLDVLFGVNLIVPHGPLSGVRLAVEAGVPAYQYLDGPGLKTDWTVTTGLQYAF